MPIEIQGREAAVDRRDRDRGFRVEVSWSALDDDGEPARYRIETWVAPYLDDDEPRPDGRRGLTNDVCRRVIEGVLAEKAQDDARFHRAVFHEVTEVRAVTFVGETGFEGPGVDD